MCLQSPIYDVIIGNVPGARPPESPEKEWKPEDDVVADGLSQEWTDRQIGMAVTIAQAKRDKQAEKPLTGIHMGSNNLCYVTRHFLFFPYVAMSLYIRP